LALPETTVVLASTALVVWTRPVAADVAPGMGLRFLGLDRQSARSLADYVDERIPALALAHRGGGT